MTIAPCRDPQSVDDYYACAAVRARIRDFCGGLDGRPPTAAYVASLGRSRTDWPSWDHVPRVPSEELDTLWTSGSDLARSLWDTTHLVFMIELDYQNTDAAAEPFLHPADVFFKLEDAYLAFDAVFHALHLHLPAVATGRGYHFTGEIPLTDPNIAVLAAIVPDTPAWYAGVDARRPPGVTAPMSEQQARAAAGLSCVIEFVAHLILERAGNRAIPLVVNGTPVGSSGIVGRECVSIDFSHMGDPLDTRHVRMPFSTYQWHRLRPDLFGRHTASSVPPIAVVPRGRHSLLSLLREGRSLAAASRAAAVARTYLPDITRGMTHLLAAYGASSLYRFHSRFYEALRHATPPEASNLDGLPPCMAAPLRRPNDLLLKPEHLQHLVRGLMSLGWTPAAIARLVQSAYEADHQWGDRWSTSMNAATRAEFEVRVFAGLIETGRDALVDFNCVSAQEKGLCPHVDCRHDLRIDRAHLGALHE